MMLQVGDQFDRYQVRSHLAQGGMADLYRAVDLTTNQDVVLKIPNRTIIGDPAQAERFQRELQATQTLNHPAIQKGLGSGQYNRIPYLVTAFIDGMSLRDLISQQAPLPPDTALPLIRKIADGIAYCHEHDVIHRDLKPENILVTHDGQPIIVDFGLALTRDARRVTYANLTPSAGTPDYMSPEQIEGQRGDERTDVYAVGTMLYELLSGHTPFTGDTQQIVIMQHLRGAIPRLDETMPGLSPQLAAVVARTLQRKPEARYPTMRAFLHDLDHLDGVNTSILATGTGAGSVVPLWRTTQFWGGAVTLAIMIGLVLLFLASQGAFR